MDPFCPLCALAETSLFQLIPDSENYFDGYRLYTCGGCGVVFTHPRPGETEAASFYGEEYYSFKSASLESLPVWKYAARALVATLALCRVLRPVNAARLEKLLFRVVRNVPQMVPLFFHGRNVLDLGCGSGDQMALWREGGLDVWGVDISPIAADAGSKRGLRIFSGEIWDAGFAGGCFDIVYANQVIEHTRETNAILEEIKRVLKPGGVLIMGAPNTGSHLLRIFKSRWISLQVPLHLLHFSPASLTGTLVRHGFAIRQVYTITPAGGLLESLGKVFPRFGSFYIDRHQNVAWIAFYILLSLLLLPANLGLRGDYLYVIAAKEA